MSRLIREEDAYAVLTEYYNHRTTIQHKSLKQALSQIPTVDAVEVVRCKDCKFNYANQIPLDSLVEMKILPDDNQRWVKQIRDTVYVAWSTQDAGVLVILKEIRGKRK